MPPAAGDTWGCLIGGGASAVEELGCKGSKTNYKLITSGSDFYYFYSSATASDEEISQPVQVKFISCAGWKDLCLKNGN